PGGTYEWHIMGNAWGDGDGPNLIWDQIDIGRPETLFITATEESPFSIRIISLNASGQAGVIGGFVAGELYSAMIISSYSVEPADAFNTAKFSLDVSQFQTNLGTGPAAGSFSLTLDGSNLMLNFTAVPEPSTYALMLVGLGFVGWTVWRRRHY
ncbi:MAG: PEP-CTERM sorting domain-containing protein, partial [Gammaproteobacteria bacterium]|nr:PEP-CTERM sorting domain-containing protein [Gammaproteobacteria bacterium]